MFTDAFGEKYFLSDKRHGVGMKPPLFELSEKKSRHGKVTRTVGRVNANCCFRGKMNAC
jgi:hypothetical protein